MNISDKLTSRKFWLSAAAFLSSLGVSIAGIAAKSDTVTAIGLICSAVSAAIYAACEAVVDKAAVVFEAEAEDTDTVAIGFAIDDEDEDYNEDETEE